MLRSHALSSELRPTCTKHGTPYCSKRRKEDVFSNSIIKVVRAHLDSYPATFLVNIGSGTDEEWHNGLSRKSTLNTFTQKMEDPLFCRQVNLMVL